MSMHDVEYATELLAEAVAGARMSNEAKRAALHRLFRAEDRCDVGFCRIGYRNCLEACGFSVLIPREDVPEDLVDQVHYWKGPEDDPDDEIDEREYAYVDRTFPLWEVLEKRSLLAPYMKEEPDASPDTPDFPTYMDVLDYLSEHTPVFSDAAREEDDYFLDGIRRTAAMNGWRYLDIEAFL